jgi:hypothetical protein
MLNTTQLNVEYGGRAVCGHSIAGIAGSNSADGMDVLLLCLFRVVQVAADGSLRGVLQGVGAFKCE